MRASEIMSRTVVTTHAQAPLLEAIDLMVSHAVSGLPVLDAHGAVAGMITESDLLDRAELGVSDDRASLWSVFSHAREAVAFAQLHGRIVADVMTHGVIAVAGDTALSDIATILHDRNIRCVPVIEDGRLLGMISRLDLMRVVRTRLAEIEPPLDDQAIVARLQQKLHAARWAPRGITFSVKNGTVGIEGVARDVADIDALRAMAEGIPGVSEIDSSKIFLLSPGTGYSRPEDIAG